MIFNLYFDRGYIKSLDDVTGRCHRPRFSAIYLCDQTCEQMLDIYVGY